MGHGLFKHNELYLPRLNQAALKCENKETKVDDTLTSSTKQATAGL